MVVVDFSSYSYLARIDNREKKENLLELKKNTDPDFFPHNFFFDNG